MNGDNELTILETKREREQFEVWYITLMGIFQDNPTQREIIRSSKHYLWQQWLEHKPERDSATTH